MPPEQFRSVDSDLCRFCPHRSRPGDRRRRRGRHASAQHPATAVAPELQRQFEEEIQELAPERFVEEEEGKRWHPGDAPSQALQWAVQSVAKAGTIAVIGVYPQGMRFFAIGQAMNENLTIRMGNCPHRRYIPELMEIVAAGAVQPERVITQAQPITSAIDAYRMFDEHRVGWARVDLRR